MSELNLEKVPQSHSRLPQLRLHFIEAIRKATETKERLSMNRFPGTMALTLSRRHLHMIAENDYVVLEKSDGTRYMLYAVGDMVFLIDRLMEFYVVQPNPEILNVRRDWQRHTCTILDGELVRNLVTEQYEFLIYDAVVVDEDFEVGRMDFRQRMSAVELHVVAPRVTLPFATGLLRLRIKDYFEKGDLARLFSHIKRDVRGEYVYINNDRRDGAICNQNDGVIFTPVRMPYIVKNCDALLKWKPPHLDSVDFKLKLERTTDPRSNAPSVRPSIAYKGERGIIVLRQVHFPTRQKLEWARNFDRFNDSIVELSYDRLAGEWRYIRQRDDKTNPNFASTVIDTLESIAENMDREELVSFLTRQTRPPPADARCYLEAQEMNDRACKVRNDLFDTTNKAYLLSTPISLVPPPQEAPRRRPNRDGARGRGGGARDGPRDGAQRTNNHVGNNDGEGELRQQPDYSDDV